jgi:REP element-mobilizing transposase RayT
VCICTGHVYIRIEMPPKYAVASVIGFVKGKREIAIARPIRGNDWNFTQEHFGAGGYAASTVGFDEKAVRKCIRDQYPSNRGEGAFYATTPTLAPTRHSGEAVWGRDRG